MFTENVSRHGSRAASDSEDGDLVLALWAKAAAEGQLTRVGERFGGDVKSLLAAMDKVGYGQLSGRGERELVDTAARLRKRLPTLFERIVGNSERIDVVNSGKDRAVESGNLFAAALADNDPALKPLITRPGPTPICSTSTSRPAARSTGTTSTTTSGSPPYSKESPTSRPPAPPRATS